MTMPRPVIFCDLAGTLDVRDPATGRWGPWPGADRVLADLAADFDLHLTTGEDPVSAGPSLADLGLGDHFTGIQAGLPGGGKPFGVLASSLSTRAERCLAVGDSLVNDTAGDSDRVVSVILHHGEDLVDPRRLQAVVRELWDGQSFLAGFTGALSSVADADAAGTPALDALHASDLGSGCHLGWWLKSPAARRPVVLLTA